MIVDIIEDGVAWNCFAGAKSVKLQHAKEVVHKLLNDSQTEQALTKAFNEVAFEKEGVIEFNLIKLTFSSVSWFVTQLPNSIPYTCEN